MALVLSLVVAAASTAPLCSEDRAPRFVESLEEIYRSGVSFGDFLEAATRRKETWARHYDEARVPDEVSARAARVRGTWRILAVAEDWCSDSVNTIPYLARMAEETPVIELRIVDSDLGRTIMETHLTPDGRPSTPTVLVLDEEYGEVGCWVERPSELQDWALENRSRLGDDFLPQKMAWYREDAGQSTMDEVLAVIEAAASGESICRKG